MKKIRIVVLALGLMVLSAMPTKKTHAQTGRWIVTIYSLTHWVCTQGGAVCCPGFDC